MPSVVVPSLKVTVPVSVPNPPVSAAANVTAPPKSEGFCEAVTLIVLELNLKAAITIQELLKPFTEVVVKVAVTEPLLETVS